MAIDSGRPRLGTVDDLLTEPVVLGRARRLGRKGEYRFLVGGALLEAYALGDHRLEYFPAKHFLNLRADVARQGGPLVFHHTAAPENAQRRIGARPDLLNRFEQVVGA